MALLINLNKARKRKARIDAAKQAADNRIRFGRSKAQKQQDADSSAAAQRALDGKQREPGATDTTVTAPIPPTTPTPMG